jgi:hypothetical protein
LFRIDAAAGITSRCMQASGRRGQIAKHAALRRLSSTTELKSYTSGIRDNARVCICVPLGSSCAYRLPQTSFDACHLRPETRGYARVRRARMQRISARRARNPTSRHALDNPAETGLRSRQASYKTLWKCLS